MQFVSMTAKQFRKIAAGKKENKYHAKKTVVNDITYDSKKESKRALELQYMQKAGKIKNLQSQVRFILQEDYINNKGQKIRPISYIADYVYEQDGKTVVEDVKGWKTKEYKIKKKMFEYKYPQYVFIES